MLEAYPSSGLLQVWCHAYARGGQTQMWAVQLATGEV